MPLWVLFIIRQHRRFKVHVVELTPSIPLRFPLMSHYVDGFVLPLPSANTEAYREMATKASAIWIEHGALSYRECLLDDPAAEKMVRFPEMAGCAEGETVIFAFVTYRDRAHRDEVNAKIMTNPRMQELCSGSEGGTSPFDYTRMAYGGFTTLVERDAE
jgi:uncharacterized protein YbaA (DUF1428 family)